MKKTLDLTRVPKEVHLILELLKDDNGETIQKNQEAICKDIDWDLFLEYVMHHRVFPLLRSKVKILDENLVPESVVQFLTEQYKRNTFRMLQLAAEMEQISKQLAKDDIQTIFLKGPVIAYDLYGDMSLRTSSDLDFLIPIEYLDRTTRLLFNQGYEQTEFIDSIFDEWKWRNHHLEFIHPQKRIKVEIHWRLHPGPSKEATFQELWKRSRISGVTKYPVHFLSKEDLFHFLVLHGARHGWSRLRWLIDVQQMLKQNLDWDFVYKLYKSSHSIELGGQSILLLTNLLNTKVTHEMQPFFDSNRILNLAERAVFFIERRVNLHSEYEPEDIIRYYWNYIYSIKSTHLKILFILSKLHPNVVDAKLLPLPKKFHILYFPLQPFLLFWRKVKQPPATLNDFK